MPSPPMLEFSPARREVFLQAAVRVPSDVVVLGGGLGGAAVARDAALRGLRVTLLERGDLASGASGCPLTRFQAGLGGAGGPAAWLATLRERALWTELAPQRVRVLPLLVPRGRTAPGPDAADLEGADGSSEAVAETPWLTLDMLRGAAAAGAAVLPHAEALEVRRLRPGTWAVSFRDARTGREETLEAAAVVNATGDGALRARVAPARSGPGWASLRQVHLALPRSLFPAPHGLLLETLRPGGGLAILPWRDVALVQGPEHPGGPGPVTAAEARSLLEELQALLPGLDLPVDPGAGAWTRSRMAGGPSEGFLEGPEGFWTLTGGNRVDVRRVAREVLNRVVPSLGPRAGVGKPGACSTALVPLQDGPELGAPGPETALHARAAGLEPEAVRALRARQPGDWAPLLELMAGEPALARPLPPLEGPGSGHLQGEVVHAVRHQMTMTLADLVCRRLALSLRAPGRAGETLAAAGGLMARELGWDEGERSRQEDLARAELARNEAWRAGPGEASRPGR